MEIDYTDPLNIARYGKYSDYIMKTDNEVTFERACVLSLLVQRPKVEVYALLSVMRLDPSLSRKFTKMFEEFEMLAKLSNFEEINQEKQSIIIRARQRVEYDVKKDFYEATKEMLDHEIAKPANPTTGTRQTENDRVISTIDHILCGTFFVDSSNEKDLESLKGATGLKLVKKGWLTPFWQFENKEAALKVRSELVDKI
jgi:hypothetical protein